FRFIFARTPSSDRYYRIRPYSKPSPCACPSGALYSTFKPGSGKIVENVGILIIDDDAASQGALCQVLGAEGCLVEAAGSSSQAFQQLATGKWTLVLANVETTGVTGALFNTLRELALPPEGEAAKARVRVLFVVPEAVLPRAK